MGRNFLQQQQKNLDISFENFVEIYFADMENRLRESTIINKRYALQEWKDMQKLMYELQRQSREIKRTQQDISSLKKQLSELRGLFKGKERKSLEGRIELLEDLEKRLHKSLEQIVKREGYPNVQAFQKVYNKAEELIIEYNEELRAWKNQTEQKKERPLEQPKKESVLEKLHRCQQEGRQQPKRSVKRKSMDRER